MEETLISAFGQEQTFKRKALVREERKKRKEKMLIVPVILSEVEES